MPRILIVDDDFTIKLELEEMLAAAGYEVVGEAESGRQAIEMANNLSPDLILMDIILHGEMDGISAAEIIKKKSNIPVVFMSGHGDPDFIERAKRLEPFGYVMKPFDETEVKAFVEIALYKSKTQKELETAHKKIEKTNLALKREIEKRKRSDRTIKAEEEKYRFLADNLADIVWITDENFQTGFVTPSIETVLGFTREDRKKQSLEEMVTPDSVRRARALLAREIQGEIQGNADPERSITMDVEYYRKDGSTLWMESCVKFIRDKNGSVKGMLGASRDISKRRHREKEIERLRKEWEGIFQAIGNPTLIVDRNHNIIHGNAATEKATGKSRKDLVGAKCYELFHHSDQPPETCPLEKMLKTGRLETVEMEIEALEGKFLVSCTPMLDREGQIEKVIHIATDITERKRAEMERERLEAQLRHIRKMEAISTLTGGIAHDYNNLLSVIMGNLSMALDEARPGSDLENFLGAANVASQKVRDLTHELMALSKGGDFFKEPGSLKEILVHAVKAVPPESGVDIKESIFHDLWPVSFDPHKMKAVFRNVVTNAIEAMPNGGTVAIKGDNLKFGDGNRCADFSLPPGDYVRISIQDQGKGILPEQLDKIFDPYFSTKDMGVQKGMGLGLTTAYAIVQKHGGHLSVESEPGLGTMVNIYLPAERHHDKSDGKIHPQEDFPSSGKRVLLMDDEEMLRKLAKPMLKKMGYEVETVKNGLEAIETYKMQKALGTPFHAVILDLTIKGGMGGEQTMGKLLRIDPDVKAIVSSGYFDDPVMSHFEDYGFRGAMAKPYEKNKLQEELAKLFE